MNKKGKWRAAAAVLFVCILAAGVSVLAVWSTADKRTWHGENIWSLIRHDMVMYVLPFGAAAVVILFLFGACLLLGWRRELGAVREKPDRAAKRSGSRRLIRLLLQYFLSLMAAALGLVALAAVAWWLCGLRTWEKGFIYSIISWCHENVIVTYCLALLVVWFAVSAAFYFKLSGFLDDVAEAAKKLARPEETPIDLPPALENIEAELELARTAALRHAQAARDQEQRKNDLIVYLAHDLKTPLTSVIGYLTLLQDGGANLPEALREKYTGVALNKAQRLEELINEFFEIARFNLSHIELEKQTVDLSRMLTQVVSEFEPVFAERELTCRLHIAQKLMYFCDPDKLARVFDNLLRNAGFYSTAGSTVTISGEERDGQIVLAFENAGKTIPKEKLERIFDQFYRLDASRTTSTGGAGLGLAIARQIVELHGGTITAESADNKVVFTVRLPAS